MTTEVVDLGSMAVLVGTVALGWEKISMERNPLQKQLADLQQKISAAITELDLEISYCNEGESTRQISAAWMNEDHYYLLCIGRHKERLNYPADKRRSWNAWQFFWTAPFLPLMRTGRHVGVVLALTWLSVICFLFQKAGQVWGISHIDGFPLWDDQVLFWIYASTIVVTLFLAMLAHRLSRVEPKCDGLLEGLKKQKEHEESKLREMMKRGLDHFMKHIDKE